MTQSSWPDAGVVALSEHFPVASRALAQMLTRRPGLAELQCVRELWEQLLRASIRDLFDVQSVTFSGWSTASRRAALIYLANVAPTSAVAPAHQYARDVIALTAARVPRFARSSIDALDDAIANVAAHVRLTRAARRRGDRV